jgi:hypothetical protein
VVHRDFNNAETGSRGLHLHFQIPAVSLLAHIELRERIASDGPKRTHVCVANAVEQSHDPPGNSPG